MPAMVSLSSKPVSFFCGSAGELHPVAAATVSPKNTSMYDLLKDIKFSFESG
jgi:hypothetical protein